MYVCVCRKLNRILKSHESLQASHEVMTRTTTYTPSCAWQSCFSAFAERFWTPLVRRHLIRSLQTLLPSGSAPKNITLSIIAKRLSPSIWLWGRHLRFKHPASPLTTDRVWTTAYIHLVSAASILAVQSDSATS